MTNVGVAIVGCGLVGQRRAKALAGARLLVCMDSDHDRAKALAGQHPGSQHCADLGSALAFPGVDVVVVATTNDSLVPCAIAAVRAGKHVLLEKPGARRVAELDGLIGEVAGMGVKVRVGFNHRFHPAFRKAMEIFRAGGIGNAMMIRGRYGHGGRKGYDREWRARPERSGGGELLDQGVHLIDLSRWFLGEFSKVEGLATTLYWDMKVEDNGYLLLRTDGGKVAFLHASCSEWKNIFSFELYGREGKLQIEGLGGSYGLERLLQYRMLPEMGPPETTTWEFPRGDDSWDMEFAEFIEDIRLGREPDPGLTDARCALTIVEEIYRRSKVDHRA
jgi:predicted dehydrogenase